MDGDHDLGVRGYASPLSTPFVTRLKKDGEATAVNGVVPTRCCFRGMRSRRPQYQAKSAQKISFNDQWTLNQSCEKP